MGAYSDAERVSKRHSRRRSKTALRIVKDGDTALVDSTSAETPGVNRWTQHELECLGRAIVLQLPPVAPSEQQKVGETSAAPERAKRKRRD